QAGYGRTVFRGTVRADHTHMLILIMHVWIDIQYGSGETIPVLGHHDARVVVVGRDAFIFQQNMLLGKRVVRVDIINIGCHHVIHSEVKNRPNTTVSGIDTLSYPSRLVASAMVAKRAIKANANTLPVAKPDKYTYRQLSRMIRNALIKNTREPIAVFDAPAIR